MPPAETGISLGFILLRDAGRVKGRVGGVCESNSSETFVISHSTVTDDLNLGNARDARGVMNNGFLCGFNLVVSMPIDLGLMIESLEGCGEVKQMEKTHIGKRVQGLPRSVHTVVRA